MKTKKILRILSIWLQSLMYIGAGMNHFVHPATYIAMIPPYIPQPVGVNIFVGIVEILLGLLLLVWVKGRKHVGLAIVVLLVALLPAHVYHIQMQGNIPGCDLVLPVWGTWVRLGMQGVLIAWAWSARKA
jgi:uncharacterized membrane protein